MAVLEWQDVEDVAKKIFDIWVGQPELQWAMRSWNLILEEGLAEYDCELERAHVCLRFLALASIYYDWCACAWEEGGSDEKIWGELDTFGLNHFHLGWLARDLEISGENSEDLEDDEPTLWTFISLLEKVRPEVVEVLIKRNNGHAGLYESLWDTRDLDDLDDAFLITDRNLIAMDFVMTGCLPTDYRWPV